MRNLRTLFILMIGMLFLGSCGDDDVALNLETGAEVSFDLFGLESGAALGTATIAELGDGSSKITVSLNSTVAALLGDNPMHIHENTAAEGGGIAITLNSVDASGMSETTVTALDDGTMISYDQLAVFDGYINVHLSAADLGTLVAQGDIGVNAFTGESMTYDLLEKDVAGISGSAMIQERVSGETLLTLMLDNTESGASHPAHIHMNTAAEGGGIAISLISVDGANGMSRTNISALDDGTSITYNQLTAYDGYINVHNSAEDLGTLVAQGDIGVNVLTGMSVTYDLNEADVVGISGTAVFAERLSGETLVTIMLMNTPPGGSHPSHIHMNSAAQGGGIAVTLTSIDGTSGMSLTNIGELNDGTAITYSELTSYNGYINVHLSADDLATLAAQGDIGSNAN